MNGKHRNSDDWGTPEWIRSVFDGWDDPCPLGSTGMDGLLRDWGDRTFANIPYSAPSPWIEKAIAEARRGKRIVLLVRVDTSTKWWLKLIQAGARFACFQGRVDFVRCDDPNAGGHANIAVALVFLPYTLGQEGK